VIKGELQGPVFRRDFSVHDEIKPEFFLPEGVELVKDD
jgi:hypothetical protein